VSQAFKALNSFSHSQVQLRKGDKILKEKVLSHYAFLEMLQKLMVIVP